MGTTITAAYVADDAVVVAHVGDSRCYLLRGGDLVRLTRDHSLVGELVARGKLTEEQAEAHPQRSVITRALGPEPTVQVDLDVYPARPGDLFLVCSDGLTSMVHEPEVKRLLQSGGRLDQIGRRLIAAANDAGGRDNITVVLFRLEEVEDRRGRVGRRDGGHRGVRHLLRRRDAGPAPGHVPPDGRPAHGRPRRRGRDGRGRGGVPPLGHGRAAGAAPGRPATARRGGRRGGRGSGPRATPAHGAAAGGRAAARAPRAAARRLRRALRVLGRGRRPAHAGAGRRLARLPARLLRRHGPHGRPDDHHLPRAALRAARGPPAVRALRRLRGDHRPGPAERAAPRSPTTSCARATTRRTSSSPLEKGRLE